MSKKKEELLDAAQQLIQQKGVNGFSYHDLSELVQIKTSSIHYYFKTKADLMLSLIDRYHQDFEKLLSEINQKSSSPKIRLQLFAGIFEALAQEKNKFCLCGMMAAEWATLTPDAHKKLREYFAFLSDWLSIQFNKLNVEKGNEQAKAYLSLLEGALLLARTEQKAHIVRDAAQLFLNTISTQGEKYES